MAARTLTGIRTEQAQAQVQKVRKFGAYARAACTSLIVLSGVFGAIAIAIILWPTWDIFGDRFKLGTVLGAFEIERAHITTLAVKATLLTVYAVVLAVGFNGLLHLRALFDNFTLGAIYIKDNVRHVRCLGQLALLVAVLQFLQPAFAAFLVAIGVFDMSMAKPNLGLIHIGNGTLSPFVMACLILLASWIMDVGTQTNDEAEAMRREAELVV